MRFIDSKKKIKQTYNQRTLDIMTQKINEISKRLPGFSHTHTHKKTL